MRLFVAVNFNDEVKEEILRIQERLRAQCPAGNFSRPENLHLTLAFIGETAEEKAGDVAGIVDDIREAPFDLEFNRSGCFTRGSGEIWWIGPPPRHAGLSSLLATRGRLVRRLLSAGFPVDGKPFTAHVTLGRELKHPSPVVLDCPEINVRVNRVSLMQSARIRGVLTYTELFGRELR